MRIVARRRFLRTGLGFIGQHAQCGGRQHLGMRFALRRQQRVGMARDEAGVDAARTEFRMVGDAMEQVEIGRDADDVGVRQCPAQREDRLIARTAVADQLGEHRVVMG